MLEALFRVLFTYDCLGEEKIPAGPAVIAANHPSYLDPILLSLQVKRPIRFMAWDALFHVPLLGSLVRLFGEFPVDTRKGRGASALGAAKSLLEEGELVGIFPEGKRSRTGWMEEELRAGAARLALETGAPLVPASIRGAYRAWPHDRPLPGLATVRVRYHDLIDPAAYRHLPATEAQAALLAELRRRVERTLLPAVKADRRIDALWRTEAPWPRLHEAVPALGVALFVFWKTRAFSLVWPCYAYVAYLLLDVLVLPQRRLTKWVRNGSAAAFVLVYVARILPRLSLPEVTASRALLALLAGAGFAYLYERTRIALGFVQGMVDGRAPRARRSLHHADAARRARRAAALRRRLRVGGARRLLALLGARPPRVGASSCRACSAGGSSCCPTPSPGSSRGSWCASCRAAHRRARRTRTNRRTRRPRRRSASATSRSTRDEAPPTRARPRGARRDGR